MSLFELGTVTLASGQVSPWKINCDALTEEDWNCLAQLGVWRLQGNWPIPRPFGSVVGVPRGGLPFARAIEQFATNGPRLVVDDVFTTGGSIRKIMKDGDLALVAFARTPPPAWLCAVWELTEYNGGYFTPPTTFAA